MPVHTTRSVGGFVAILVIAGCTLGRTAPTVPAGADVPQDLVVSDWQAAAGYAGVPLFAPASGDLGSATITVRGVPGDPIRPIDVRYEGGLHLVETHRDVLPPPDDPAEEIPVRGADQAWRGEVRGTDYLYVRRGDTLILLDGRTDEARIQIAESLAPVAVPP